MCVTTRGQGTEGCRGAGVGVKGVCVSIVGMGEDTRAGHESSVGVSQQKQKKSEQPHT